MKLHWLLLYGAFEADTDVTEGWQMYEGALDPKTVAAEPTSEH